MVNKKVTSGLSFFLSLAALIILPMTTSSSEWLERYDEHSGLWIHCHNLPNGGGEKCITNDATWLKCCQAFAVLSIIFLFAGLILILLDLCLEKVQTKHSAITLFLSSLFQLIVMIIYEEMTVEMTSHGTSYFIGWLVFALQFAAAIIQTLGVKFNRNYQDLS
ncbi:epithelial membrane protein 1-like [Clytia hemisphaerica]|uniref:Cnidarian restricted protein n=1 Tax=Clytia hemisphaerica TaxID=252671 RepID=A0A7M5WIB7_9CNID|eukprot:TCONS_00032423-protein